MFLEPELEYYEGSPFQHWFGKGSRQLKRREYFNDQGNYHNPNGPAAEAWFKSGLKQKDYWYLNGRDLQKEPLRSWLEENSITDLRFNNWTETQQILFKLT